MLKFQQKKTELKKKVLVTQCYLLRLNARKSKSKRHIIIKILKQFQTLKIKFYKRMVSPFDSKQNKDNYSKL